MCCERVISRQSPVVSRREKTGDWRLTTGDSLPGFSLIEMMAVLVLIGLLAGLVIVNVRPLMARGKQEAARAQIASFNGALSTFDGVYGRFPTNEEGLEILAKKTSKLSEPLLAQRAVPLDPWGRPYQYNSPGRAEPYEIICYGADGREGGTGADADVVSWQLQDSAGNSAGGANAATP